MTDVRSFGLDDILSVITGKPFSQRRMGGLYEICNHLSGHSLMTHELAFYAPILGAELLRQHPDLAGVEVPELSGRSEIDVWLSGVEQRYGASREVKAMENFQPEDPISSLLKMRRGGS